ncbi:MAG: NUDIX hydrolase [Neomegalonema sp.]|nr:NUDIX hydrolase [Neomegalonema sp.]
MAPQTNTEKTAIAPERPLRDAATLVLVRKMSGEAHVLMGQRGGAASFMPNKVVFPGGALDPGDREARPEAPLRANCLHRLRAHCAADLGTPLAMAALRELREETGLQIPHDLTRLRFFFRAITPPGQPRRFDARFFLAQAEDGLCDWDDFSGADGELSHLGWRTLQETRALPLPFITNIVIHEVEAWLARGGDLEEDRPVPFFRHTEEGSFFEPL